jgi:ABC-type oligopeptide transport system substrate-binding subunit
MRKSKNLFIILAIFLWIISLFGCNDNNGKSESSIEDTKQKRYYIEIETKNPYFREYIYIYI